MEEKTILKGFAIVVADRGFVYVGDIEYDGVMCVVRNAKNIRRWGTTKGLGEIADNGPTEKTVLDAYGTIRIPQKSIITFIDAKAEKWN